MTETLLAALHTVSDGPVRLQAALRRNAQRLRAGATTGAAALVANPLPSLLLDGGLGPLLSERMRALLTTAAAPSSAGEAASARPQWPPASDGSASPPASQFGDRAALTPRLAPTAHPAPTPPAQSQQSRFADSLDAAGAGIQTASAAAPAATPAPAELTGAALLRDRIARALAAQPVAQSAQSARPGLPAGASPASSTAANHEPGAHSHSHTAAGPAMAPAETEAALRAFVEGRPIAGRAAVTALPQTTDAMAGAADGAANGVPTAQGAGSRSTLAPSAHFAPQGFAFGEALAATPLAPDALADSLATILRTQARAHGIELP